MLTRRFGYADDLYVHFTDLGFRLLRPGGGFGFIVSDTFFTLGTKERMRELLQSHDDQLPRANVIRSMPPWMPQSSSPDADKTILTRHMTFIQARPRWLPNGKRSTPEIDLPDFSAATKWIGRIANPPPWAHDAPFPPITLNVGSLRVHRLRQHLYPCAHKRAFFEPQTGTLRLLQRFNDPVKKLWRIGGSASRHPPNSPPTFPRFENIQKSSNPAMSRLSDSSPRVGKECVPLTMLASLATVKERNKPRRLAEKADAWHLRWLDDERTRISINERLYHHGGIPILPPAKQRAAWEATVHELRAQFTPAQLGFSKMDLFRIVPRNLIAVASDYRFAFDSRRKHLLTHWQDGTAHCGFLETREIGDRS